MVTGRVNLRAWALRVITWDAVLPACIAFLPLGIKLLFPDRRGFIELTIDVARRAWLLTVAMKRLSL
jgi:hypothetical protein